MANDIITQFFTDHPYLSGLLVEISGNIFDKGFSWIEKKIGIGKTEFETAIRRIYEESIWEIRNTIAVEDTDEHFLYASYFFRSKIFIKAVVEATINDTKLEIAELVLRLKNEGSIEKLSERNVQVVVDIFKKKLSSNPQLKELEIKERYPHKIFGIDSKLDLLQMEWNH